MINQVSTSSFSGVKKNLTVFSLIVIIYHFAGGGIIDSTLNMTILNIKFEEPQRLVYVLLAFYCYWVYWYFRLNNFMTFEGDFNSDIKHYLQYGSRELDKSIKPLLEAKAGKEIKWALYKTNYNISPNNTKLSASVSLRDNDSEVLVKLSLPEKNLKEVKRRVQLNYPATIENYMPIILTIISISLILTSLIKFHQVN